MARADNVTFILGNWTRDLTIGCTSWTSPNHVIFQLANCVLMVGLLAPAGKKAALFMRGFFVFGFLLMSVWSWAILCATDFLIWNFSFMVINIIQTVYLMYTIRTVKFCDELEEVYAALFEPISIPRHLFKKVVSADYCTFATLHDGEFYATQGVSKADKLGLLMSGKMHVYSHNNLLHQIEENEFIDSPEFESGACSEEKYQVSIIATSVCHYIFWSRPNLEYLFFKEPQLATVFSLILGRDITNKLYAINEKVTPTDGLKVDIRLQSIKSRQDHLCKADVRSQPPATGINVDNDEHTAEADDTENTELLNGHVRLVGLRSPRLSTCSEYLKGSHSSVNSCSSKSENSDAKVMF